MKCNRCGTENNEENKFCTNCGNELLSENNPQEIICDECGEKTNPKIITVFIAENVLKQLPARLLLN